MNPPLYIDLITSPLGVLLLAHCGGYLCALDFQDYEARFRQMLARRFGNLTLEQRTAPDNIRAPLDAYLSGSDIAAVDEIPVHATGTRLQQQLWRALRRIPAGRMLSFADLARSIGQPVREVEQASTRNPIAIIVPCHRLVGNDGGLAAYVGGLARKRWLLAHEGVLAADAADTGDTTPAALLPLAAPEAVPALGR